LSYLQVILPLESLRTQLTHVLPLITVSEFVFGESTGVVESLAADGALSAIARGEGVLARPTLGSGLQLHWFFGNCSRQNSTVTCVLAGGSSTVTCVLAGGSSTEGSSTEGSVSSN